MVIISVVGSIHMDFYVKLPKLPQPDETVMGYGFTMMPGGKGANQAVCAAKLGAKTYMIGRVGKDIFGERALQSLVSAGVNIDYVTIDEETHTGIAFILLDTAGENMIAVAPGTDYKVSERDVDRAIDVIKQSDSLLLQLEIPINTVIYAAKVAYRHGVRVLLNPAPAMALPKELYSYIDVLVPNRTEAEMLTSIKIDSIDDAVKAGRELIGMGIENVVITMGNRGAVIVSKDFYHHVPAFKVDVVDTTGAGDVFVAALGVFLSRGMDIVNACRYACAAAALKISRMGAQSAPTLDEVENFIKQHQLISSVEIYGID